MSIDRVPVVSPLALAVLNLLNERPMHPYEMRALMRERGYDAVVKTRGGSLYDTVERLRRAGFVEALETMRDGRRPERTIYALTESGAEELRAGLRDLLREPTREYPRFAAALAFLFTLSPEEVIVLLRHRSRALDSEIASADDPPASVEHGYGLALRRAERAWVCELLHRIENGRLTWRPDQDAAGPGS